MFHRKKLREIIGRCHRLNGLLKRMFPHIEDLQLKEMSLKKLKKEEESLLLDLSGGISYILFDLEATRRELIKLIVKKRKK